MNVRVRIVLDFFATQTFIAAVGGDAVGLGWILTVQRFRQGAGERFQFFKLMAGEEVGVAEPPPRERALQKLDALRLSGKFCEGHAVFQRVVAGAGGGNQIQTGILNATDFAVLSVDRQAGFARDRGLIL